VAAQSAVLKDSFLTVAGPYRICTCFPIKPEGTLSRGLNCQGYYTSFSPGVKETVTNIYRHKKALAGYRAGYRQPCWKKRMEMV
jgi:hypothetical protein